MPTYDYKCTKCQYTFEHFQAMSEEPLVKCPKCSSTVRRLISGGTGLIFKGSGFYKTDYNKQDKTATKKSTKPEKKKDKVKKKND